MDEKEMKVLSRWASAQMPSDAELRRRATRTMTRAWLTAIHDFDPETGQLTFVEARVYSEPPWGITRPDGYTQLWTVVLEGAGPDFASAVDHIKEWLLASRSPALQHLLQYVQDPWGRG